MASDTTPRRSSTLTGMVASRLDGLRRCVARWVTAAAVVTLGWLAWERPVHACSPLPCDRNGVVPGGGSIPAGLAGIVWASSGEGDRPGEAGDFALFRIDGGRRTRVRLASHPRAAVELEGQLLVPEGGFVPGARYAYAVGARCTHTPGPVKFEGELVVAPEAPRPTRLGVLRAAPARRGVVEVGTSIGSCSVHEDVAYVDVELAVDPAAEPYREAFFYETWVDGQRYLASSSIGIAPPLGASWVGRGADRIYTLCREHSAGFPGVSAGRHTVELRARVLGEGEPIASAPLDFALDCTALPPSNAPAPSFAPLRAAPPPATAAPGPAVPAGAAVPEGPAVPASPPPTRSACACALVARADHDSAASLLLCALALCALALGARARRRPARGVSGSRTSRRTPASSRCPARRACTPRQP